MSNVVYLSAYRNNFGPKQSYHAFCDVLIRMCDELQAELEKIDARWKEQRDHSLPSAIKYFRRHLRIYTQLVDTYSFLHRTMVKNHTLVK